jgi:uncharacterized protein (DUF1330 family)
MAGYIVADIEITDPDEYQTYSKQTQATLEPYGGKFIVRGGNAEMLEGDWEPKRLVIIEFPSVEQATAWYNSPGYLSIVGIRHHSAVSRIFLVQGV